MTKEEFIKILNRGLPESASRLEKHRRGKGDFYLRAGRRGEDISDDPDWDGTLWEPATEGWPYYRIDGDKVVVLAFGPDRTSSEDLWVWELPELPPNVEFMVDGDIYLLKVESIPRGVVFDNEGNSGDVLLSPEVFPVDRTRRTHHIIYSYLTRGNSFKEWAGNIEGVNHRTLLNNMIKKGLFEK